MSLKQTINELIPDELKEKLKPYLAKFSAQSTPATPVVTPATPAQLSAPIETKLKDGTTFQTDKMEVGGTATIVSETGAMPAADGDYEAEDGTIITVSGGLISAIKPAETSPAAPAPSNDMPAMMAAMSARLEALENQNKSLQAKFEAATTEASELKAATGLTLEAVKLMLSAPAGDPIEFQNKTKVEKTEDEMTNYELAKFRRGEKIYKYV